jgi:F-type H+-transporting ATPase subunit b
VDINLTLIGQTIAMIVFVWFCMKFIWPPILGAIEERQKQIAEGLAAADEGEKRLTEARAEADDIVADARKQATSILDQAHARANEIVAEGKSDGVRERERQLSVAKAEIDGKAHEDSLGKLAQEL